MDEREKNLPKWAQELINDLRRQVRVGQEPLLKELNGLRPQMKLLKAKYEAMEELLASAARGYHKPSEEIMDIIRAYNLPLTKPE